MKDITQESCIFAGKATDLTHRLNSPTMELYLICVARISKNLKTKNGEIIICVYHNDPGSDLRGTIMI